MIEMTSRRPGTAIRTLLSYVTSQNIDFLYKDYLQASNQNLLGFIKEDRLIGCIGIERNGHLCIIKHIAVSPQYRGTGIGSSMIQFLLEDAAIKKVIAETDKEAVNFYRKFNFSVTSLGEKYPGVERFHCIYCT